MTDRPQAWVDQLEPVVRLLNSGLDAATDPLATVASCRFWLGDRGYPGPRTGPAARDLLVDLRAQLRGAIEASGQPGTAGHATSLNDLVRRAGATPHFEPGAGGGLGWRLTAPAGAPRYAAALLTIAMTAVTAGTWGRLRVCPGTDCGRAFVDTTRAGRRIWCDMSRCGNRAKQARWRSTRTTRPVAAATPPRGPAGDTPGGHRSWRAGAGTSTT